MHPPYNHLSNDELNTTTNRITEKLFPIPFENMSEPFSDSDRHCSANENSGIVKLTAKTATSHLNVPITAVDINVPEDSMSHFHSGKHKLKY